MNEAVSRETPPVPEVARGVFTSSLPLAERYAGWLSDQGVLRGLIGPREVSRLWERHLINCALLGRVIPADADVCDVGSGAGLPGLVLAISRPDLSLTLVEPLLRRTTFLSEVVDELALSNVEVLRARAEEIHGYREFSVVTSRAVAPLGRLLAWSMPLVQEGGEMIAMKGASAEDEVQRAGKTLRALGAGKVSVQVHGRDIIDHGTTVVRVVAGRPSGLGLDRQRTMPARRTPKKRNG